MSLRDLYWAGAVAWTVALVFPLTHPLARAVAWACGDWRYSR